MEQQTLNITMANMAAALDDVQQMLHKIEDDLISKNRALPQNAANLDLAMQSLGDLAQFMNHISTTLPDDACAIKQSAIHTMRLEWLRAKISNTTMTRPACGHVTIF